MTATSAKATAGACSVRTARSPRAAAWKRSRPARAAGRRFILGKKNTFEPTRSGAQAAAAKPAARPAPALARAAEATKPRRARRGDAASFIPPQLCKRVARPPAGEDWVHEIKLDGYRMQLRAEGGGAVMRTRKASTGPASSRQLPKLRGLPDCIVDGEVVALDRNGAPDLRRQAALSEGRSRDLTYFVFDLLFAGRRSRKLPFSERKDRLKTMLGRNGEPADRIKYVEHLAEPGDAVLKSACTLNLEGIVSSARARLIDPDAPRPGTSRGAGAARKS